MYGWLYEYEHHMNMPIVNSTLVCVLCFYVIFVFIATRFISAVHIAFRNIMP